MEYYEVLNQLAQGGQGITMRVRRKQDNSVVVLKQSFCDHAKAGNSALREAKTLQGLDHPHIVRYEDVFLTEDGRQLVVCLVMAYMEGGDMARYMIAIKRHGMQVEPNRVVSWTKQLASAIAYLHSNKIVHRDLKPQNVFMADDNTLKVGDFGLAQTIERGKRTSHVGTPCYMAPEVLQNDAYADAVDVWGIGCMLLEAVTLEFLWERRGMLAGQVLSDPIRADKLPADYPLPLRECIAACLQAKPEARPAAAIVLDTLENQKKDKPSAMSEINQIFGAWQANATKAFSGLWLSTVKEQEEAGPERAILSVAPPSRFLLPKTADARRTQLEVAARRDETDHLDDSTGRRRRDAVECPHPRDQGDVMSYSPNQAPALSHPQTPGGQGHHGEEVGDFLDPGTSLKAASISKRGPSSAQPSPTNARNQTTNGVSGGRDKGGGSATSLLLRCSPTTVNSLVTPLGYVGRTPLGGTSSRRGQNMHQQLFDFPASIGEERGSIRKGGADAGKGQDGAGEELRQEFPRDTNQSFKLGSPQHQIPPEIIEQYKESGLFAIDAKWRASLQSLVHSQHAVAAAATAHMSRTTAADESSPTGGKKGGLVRSLAASVTGSSKEAMVRSYSQGETLHWGMVHSISSVSSTSGRGKKDVMPGQTVELSPSMRAAWQADHVDRNSDEVVRIVRKGQKEYELKFSSDNWEAARQKCRGSGDEAVQEEYLRMFGPPARRYIGTVERLTAV